MLQLLIQDIAYSKAAEFLDILTGLLDLGDFDEEDRVNHTLRKLSQDKVSGSFLTYCVNPLKILIMIVDIAESIGQKYTMLFVKTDEVKALAIELAIAVIEEAAAGDDVQLMIEDKMYNGLEVIDMIAYLDVKDILNSPVMDIVSSYWEGPYEKASFWYESTNWQVCTQVFNGFSDSSNFRSPPHALRNP